MQRITLPFSIWLSLPKTGSQSKLDIIDQYWQACVDHDFNMQCHACKAAIPTWQAWYSVKNPGTGQAYVICDTCHDVRMPKPPPGTVVKIPFLGVVV